MIALAKGKWQAALRHLFPIQQEEGAKVFLLCLIKFFFSFLFLLLSAQKNSNLVIGTGAEKVPSAKIIVAILSILSVTAYTACANRFRLPTLLSGILGTFTFLFALYAFVISPYSNQMTPDVAHWLVRYEDNAFLVNGIIIFKHWQKLLFYGMTESAGQFLFMIFFWSLAKDLFSTKAARRVFPIFIASGCLGGLLGTYALPWLSKRAEYGKDPYADKQAILNELSRQFCLIGIGTMAVVALIFWWLNKQYKKPTNQQRPLQQKGASLWQGIKYIAGNPTMRSLLLIVTCTAITISLTDITYKRYAKNFCKDIPSAYAGIESSRRFYSLLLSTITALLLSRVGRKHLSLRTMAYTTPIVITLSGCSFLLASSLCHNATFERIITSLFGAERKASDIVFSMGYCENILAITMKYSFFDTIKEIAYMKLSQEEYKRGKAVIDILGSRSGKGLSSAVHIVLFLCFNTDNVADVSHILLIVFISICTASLYSARTLVKSLGRRTQSTTS